jgi:predicted DNA binding CopG/RHH family protein
MEKHRDYQDLGDVDLPPDVTARVDAAIAEADRDVPATRVNFRWGRRQLEVVKRAADLAGVPYQSWLKQVVWEAAIAQIRAATAAFDNPNVLARASDAAREPEKTSARSAKKRSRGAR